MRIDRNVLAAMRFELRYADRDAVHSDVLHAPRVNMWRDIFLDKLERELMGRQAGDIVQVRYKPGEIVGRRRDAKVLHLDRDQFRPLNAAGRDVALRLGRFYPKGALLRVRGVERDDITPFRCVGVDDAAFDADMNHPLAGLALELDVRIEEVAAKGAERGGRLTHWIEESMGAGAGMQRRFQDTATDFWDEDMFGRADAADDALFHAAPRLVSHLDATANERLAALYGGLVPNGARVLDLMAGHESHLPDGLALASVDGLGMNAEELAANPRLGRRVVHDLNTTPELPFDDAAFDAVVCSLSVEYLVNPDAVFASVGRVLRPGGLFVVAFSDRWFPGKSIRLWLDLHAFERMGFVLDLMRRAGVFGGLHTWSERGLPRPVDDPHFPAMRLSDPLFAVWGATSAAG
ncbi:MAG: methyltransferase domain-containing protein [Desulfovibrionaceae bacterium]